MKTRTQEKKYKNKIMKKIKKNKREKGRGRRKWTEVAWKNDGDVITEHPPTWLRVLFGSCPSNHGNILMKLILRFLL
jgi:hypothetical protein